MDRVGNHSGPWNSDPEVQIEAAFEVTDQSLADRSFRGSLQAGDIVYCRYSLNNPSNGLAIQHVKRGSSVTRLSEIAIKKRPKILELSPENIVRNVVNLENMTKAEQHLLRLGFGADFSTAAIQSLNSHRRGMALDRAQEALNERLKSFFPSSMPFAFRFMDIAGQGKEVGISLVDGVQGYTPVESRGSGVRRLLTLMGLILQEANPNEDCLVLLDEPETSLHADAQHTLRRALEALGQNPRVQVVYATHSPCMVNPARPDRIRVFSRHMQSDKATTKVQALSYSENFQQVRVSLGLTPSDSLLYGLVTILVEGDTEARCLGPLLQRLAEDKVSGFEDLGSLLESCHFVCGGGDSISYYCKLATDQNGKPVVFLDGDKPNVAAKLAAERPLTPIVQLPAGTEFENLVPESRYIAALGQELQQYDADASQISGEGFQAWSAQANLPARMMFSKRVDRWITELIGTSYNKHSVMERALRSTPTAELLFVDALRQLAATVRAQFD